VVDYDRNIGGGVTLRIRDYGQLVEFWVLAGRNTYNYNQPWSWSVNGAAGSGTFRLEKSGKWQRVAQFGVSTDQNIRFTLVNSGLGFATYNFIQHINRLSIPPQPTRVYFSELTDTSVRAMFNSQGDGGSPVLEWQLVYGTNPYIAGYEFPNHSFAWSNGSTVITGLTPASRYYFWARGRNALGWGYLSERTEIITYRLPDPPNPVRFGAVRQTSLTAWLDYEGRWNGGSAIEEWQIGYGLSPVYPTAFLPGNSDIANMLIAGRYYFWSRGRNAIGWSTWSTRSEVDLVAGAHISVGGTPRRAIPWIKDNGVWKIAAPWAKADGIWRSAG
jgi:hypothetical protein